MDAYTLSKDLQPGKLVNIYTDYKFQRKFEGVARLIERRAYGMTCMLTDENLLTKLENRVIHHEYGHLPLTTTQRENNRKFAKLTILLKGVYRNSILHVDYKLHGFYKFLQAKVSKDLENPKEMYLLINKYRNRYREDKQFKVLFDEFDNETIIQFVQQTTLKNWSHSIWREETWLVEFIPWQFCTERRLCLFNSEFRTTRKIRTLVCISPEEDAQNSEVFHYITKGNSTASNADKKELRRLVELGDLDAVEELERLVGIDDGFYSKEMVEEDDDEEDSVFTDEEREFLDDTFEEGISDSMTIESGETIEDLEDLSF